MKIRENALSRPMVKLIFFNDYRVNINVDTLNDTSINDLDFIPKVMGDVTFNAKTMICLSDIGCSWLI
jgi:hypothetical protein